MNMKNKQRHLCKRFCLFIVSIVIGVVCACIICEVYTVKNWEINTNNMLDISKMMIGLWGMVLGFIITAESILIAFDSGSITSEFKKTGHYVTVIFQYTQTSIKLLITILILVVISVIDKFSMKIFGIFIGLTVMNFVDVLISLGILYLMMRMASS